MPPSTWRDRVDLILAGAGPSPGQLVAAAVAVVAVVVGAVLWVRDRPPPPELSMPRADAPSAAAGATPTTAPSEVFAQAAGAVRRPGVYRLASDARVIDLLDAA